MLILAHSLYSLFVCFYIIYHSFMLWFIRFGGTLPSQKGVLAVVLIWKTLCLFTCVAPLFPLLHLMRRLHTGMLGFHDANWVKMWQCL